MLKFHIENESIYIDKEDNASLALSLEKYNFKKDDKVKLIVQKNNEIKLIKYGEFERDFIFFNFDKKDFENMKVGGYCYSIFLDLENVKSVLIKNKDFILEGGCYCE